MTIKCPKVYDDGVRCDGDAVIRSFKQVRCHLEVRRFDLGLILYHRSYLLMARSILSAVAGMNIMLPTRENIDGYQFPVGLTRICSIHCFRTGACFRRAGLILSLMERRVHLLLHPGTVGEAVCNAVGILSTKSHNHANRYIIAYTHIDNHRAIQGRLVKRECKTRIRIFYPVNRNDRRAIVILRGAHNHPMPLFTKVTRDALDAYRAAGEAAGIIGLTVSKCDQGMGF